MGVVRGAGLEADRHTDRQVNREGPGAEVQDDPRGQEKSLEE